MIADFITLLFKFANIDIGYQARHFGIGLNEAEKVVDQQQHIDA